jgi:ferredoxin
MNVVGVHVVGRGQHGRALEHRARAACRLRGRARKCRGCAGCWRARFARIRQARPRWRTSASASTRRWARGVLAFRAAVSFSPGACAVAIHAAGGAIHQRGGRVRRRSACSSARVRGSRHQAGVLPCPSRRRRQVHHTGAQPGQPAQRGGCVQVAGQRRDALRAQGRHPRWRRRERQHAQARRQQAAPRAAPRHRNPRSTGAGAESAPGGRREGFGLKAKSGAVSVKTSRGYPKNERSRSPCNPAGAAFTANPDEAILAAAIRQGIGLPYGCKDGACGSCKCKKLEGTVVHGTTPDQGIERRRRSRRLHPDLLRRAADRRGARVAPGHRRKRLPHQEDAVARGRRWRKSRTT